MRLLEAFWPITRASASVSQIKLVISINGEKSASIAPDQKQIAKPARPTISQATPLRYFVAIAPLCNSTYMQAALRSLNQLVADNVIEQYAIGDAIGASFYGEAVQTEDIVELFSAPESHDTTLTRPQEQRSS